MWRIFCKHNWKRAGLTIVRPRDDLVSFKAQSEFAGLRMLYGSTTITNHCEKCGKFETSVSIGLPEDNDDD